MDSFAPRRRNGWGWLALLSLGFACCSTPASAENAPSTEKHGGDYDVVIYGGTSGAVTAAVQAIKDGKTAVIVSPDKHLGGLSAGGLGWTDTGNKAVIGGLSRDFYHRVFKEYENPEAWNLQPRSEFGNKGQGTPAIDGESRTMWIFEPHVAEKVFEDYITEYKVPLDREQRLNRETGVKKEGDRIVSITALDGTEYRGKMFIDATYEGDLLAAAGVDYTVGREANSEHNETLNGVQTKNAKKHQFTTKIDPYVVPGDPSSGLLPRIHEGGPGTDGEADKRVQAYNFRMCTTDYDPNRVPFPKPDGYDPKQYELLLRTLQAGSTHVFGKFDRIQNFKTDTNNHGPFSTDNIGMNYEYPEASYEKRAEIIKEHEDYQKGYLYFLANDPRVPEEIRSKYAKWGLAKDEFTDNGNWPHQIYVREARRMKGDLIVNENHLRRKIPTERSVGMGSYGMDSHNTQRYVAHDEEGKAYVRNEGDVQVSTGGPYPIDYGAIIPKKEQCTNLFAPLAVSCTHIAYGSIRMEPVFMILGQSAASAAGMAIDEGIAVQDVDYAKLRDKLLADKQVLEYTAPPKSKKKPAAKPKKAAE